MTWSYLTLDPVIIFNDDRLLRSKNKETTMRTEKKVRLIIPEERAAVSKGNGHKDLLRIYFSSSTVLTCLHVMPSGKAS